MYVKQDWVTGEVITETKLDHMEAGIEAASFIPQVTGSGTSVTLDPNKFYVFGEVAELDVSFAAGTAGQVNEYHFSFVSGSTAAVLSLPVDVVMPAVFQVDANRHYEISVINNMGAFNVWNIEEEI